MTNKPIISIDLWGTLIKPSPSFKEAKYKLVQSYFRHWDIKDIEGRFSTIKRVADNKVESTGWQPKINWLWSGILLDIIFTSKLQRETILSELKKNYANLAIEDSPSLYADYTKDVLEEMSSRYQLVLSSNTLFLEGWVLKRILDKLDISKYFTKMNFSDELGVAKPNKLMYSDSKYHIGDNPITDGDGAWNAGSYPILINNDFGSLKTALNFIERMEKQTNGIAKICGS
jgi:putative hydrolase of the HAD superfamily